MVAVYQPSRSLPAKVRRRLVRRVGSRVVPLRLERPVVSITFDDVPASVVTTALPMLEARGWSSTLYVATGLLGTENHLGTMMTADDVRAAHVRGHEIAAHTHSHRDMAQLSREAQLVDLDRSHTLFREMGLPIPQSFAWPYGECSPSGKRLAAGRYRSLRGIAPRVHHDRVDLHQLGSVPMFHGRMNRVRTALESLRDAPGWVTLFTHDVREVPSPWGLTPSELDQALTWIADIGARVLPVRDVVANVEAAHARA